MITDAVGNQLSVGDYIAYGSGRGDITFGKVMSLKTVQTPYGYKKTAERISVMAGRPYRDWDAKTKQYLEELKFYKYSKIVTLTSEGSNVIRLLPENLPDVVKDTLV